MLHYFVVGRDKKSIVGGLIVLVAFGFLVFQLVENSRKNSNTHVSIMDKSEKTKEFPTAIEIQNPSGFVNTDPIKIQDLIGKQVILVDFWTYSCINCQRTLPYLNSWYEKYKDKGLTIIGVHTPEFDFEKAISNVQMATQKYGVKYPVVLDNNYATWKAYKNSYWPRKYLIDIDGYIVFDHIGEGAYAETEMKIRDLLAERAQKLGLTIDLEEALGKPAGTEEAGSSAVVSPETYFGAVRNTNFVQMPGQTGEFTFQEPSGTDLNYLYLAGNWKIEDEFAQNTSAQAKVFFKYRATKVFLVAGADTETKAKVLLDGKEVKEITINANDLYRLIEDSPEGEHVIELILESPGVKLFTFTFG